MAEPDRQEGRHVSRNRRRRNRRRQPKPQPWAQHFLAETEDDPEKRELREKLDLANELLVEARLRVRPIRWR